MAIITRRYGIVGPMSTAELQKFGGPTAAILAQYPVKIVEAQVDDVNPDNVTDLDTAMGQRGLTPLLDDVPTDVWSLLADPPAMPGRSRVYTKAGQVYARKPAGDGGAIVQLTQGSSLAMVDNALAGGAYNLSVLGVRDWYTFNTTHTTPRTAQGSAAYAKAISPKAIINGFDWWYGGSAGGAIFTQNEIRAGITIQSNAADQLASGGGVNTTTFTGINSGTATGYGLTQMIPGIPGVQQVLDFYWCHDSSTVAISAMLLDGSAPAVNLVSDVAAATFADRHTTVTWTSGAPMIFSLVITVNKGSSPGIFVGGITLN